MLRSLGLGLPLCLRALAVVAVSRVSVRSLVRMRSCTGELHWFTVVFCLSAGVV